MKQDKNKDKSVWAGSECELLRTCVMCVHISLDVLIWPACVSVCVAAYMVYCDKNGFRCVCLCTGVCFFGWGCNPSSSSLWSRADVDLHMRGSQAPPEIRHWFCEIGLEGAYLITAWSDGEQRDKSEGGGVQPPHTQTGPRTDCAGLWVVFRQGFKGLHTALGESWRETELIKGFITCSSHLDIYLLSCPWMPFIVFFSPLPFYFCLLLFLGYGVRRWQLLACFHWKSGKRRMI